MFKENKLRKGIEFVLYEHKNTRQFITVWTEFEIPFLGLFCLIVIWAICHFHFINEKCCFHLNNNNLFKKKKFEKSCQQ